MTNGGADARRVAVTTPRRDGVGRHVRPHRRRLRPLLRRPRVARARTSRRCSTTRRCWCASTARRTRCTGLPQYRQVVEETIEYVLRDLRHPDGGFYSAEDADSPDEHGHGHEGLFHTWTPAEVRAVLAGWTDAQVTRGARLVRHHRRRQLREDGVSRSIPNRLHARGELARPEHIERARRALFDAREQPPPPGPRRQGAHRVERAVPLGARRRGCRVPARRLEGRRRRQRRVPAPRAARPPAVAGSVPGRPTVSRGHATMRSPPTTPPSCSRSSGSAS